LKQTIDSVLETVA